MKTIKYTIIILVILHFLIINGSALFEEDKLSVQWNYLETTQKLVRGENITYNNYTITINGFSKPVTSNFYSNTPDEEVLPFVELNISNKTFSKVVPLVQQDYYITPDYNTKIKATLLPSKSSTDWVFESYSPWVILEISSKGIPSMITNIETDENEYEFTSDIKATIFIENTGTADLLNINVKILSDLKTETSSYKIDKLLKGKSIKKTIVLKSSYINTTSYYKIVTNITAYDVENNIYTSIAEKTVSMIPEIQPIPELRKSLPSKIYLKNNVMITLSMENNGRIPLRNITITDNIPDNFEPITKDELKWSTSIEPYSYWDVHYVIKPIDISKDGYTLPPANVTLILNNEQITIKSNQPKVVINGPKILLTKEVTPTEFNSSLHQKIINVIVSAKNIGNTPTKVILNDTLPENSILNNGILQYNDFLEADKEIKIEYSFTTNEKLPITIPKANAKYYELGSEGKLLSINSTEIIIKEKSVPIIIVEPKKLTLTLLEQLLFKYLNLTIP